MVQRLLLVCVACLALIAFAGCKVSPGGALDAGGDLYKAASLSPEEVKELGKASADAMDAKCTVAGSGNAYAKRLNKIVAGLHNEAGLQLNYKVYLTSDVNAYAFPDGSIRVLSGLMDMMTDDEIYFVIGHEIGHVADGDRADKIRVAYAASGVKKAAGSTSGIVGALSRSELGDIAETLVNAQFSQSQENDADTYGLGLMQKHGKNQSAAVSALRKLATPGRAPSMFDTHPGAEERAASIEKKIKK